MSKFCTVQKLFLKSEENKVEKEQKINELRNLITKISNAYGGEEKEVLEEHIKWVIKNHSLDESLSCYRLLASQIPYKFKGGEH